MKTLEEIKGNYARSVGYGAWGNLLRDSNKAEIAMALNIIAEDFANEVSKALLEEAAEKKWIKVKNEKPTPNIPVITFGVNNYGKKRTLRAVWVPRFFLESDGEYFDYVDYNEEKDEYYWPEGWYERNEYDEVNWHVDHEVTHWQPLPEPPSLSLIPKEETTTK